MGIAEGQRVVSADAQILPAAAWRMFMQVRPIRSLGRPWPDGGRGGGRQPPARADPPRNHILLEALAQAEPVLDDIAKVVVDARLDPDVGIGGDHRVQLRPDQGLQGMIRQGDPAGAALRLVRVRRRMPICVSRHLRGLMPESAESYAKAV